MAQLAAFPKCYLDDILVHKSITLFDWIEQAGQLGLDGLEMYSLFFEEKGDVYLDEVRKKSEEFGLALPMMCFSPDFTNPDPKKRMEELAKQKKAIDLTAKLGGLF